MITLLKVICHTVILFLIGCFLLEILIRWKRRHLMQKTNSLNTPSFHIPIIGHVWVLWGDPHTIIYRAMHLLEKCGKNGNFRVWAAHRLYVFIVNAEDYALTLGSPAFTKKAEEYSVVASSIMGQGLFSASDLGEWRKNRKLITPAFHFQILKSFIDNFYMEVKTFTNILWQRMEEEGEVEVHHPMGLCTLDMITQNAMGVSINAQHDDSHVFIRGMDTVLRVWYTRLLKPWMFNNFIYSFTLLKAEEDRAVRDVRCFAIQVILDKLQERLRKSNGSTEKESDVTNSKSTLTGHNEDDEDGYRSKKNLAFLDLLIESAYKDVDEWRMRRLVESLRLQNRNAESKQSGYLPNLFDRFRQLWETHDGLISKLFDNLCKNTWTRFDGKDESPIEKSQKIFDLNGNEDCGSDEKDAELEKIAHQLRDEVVTIIVGGQETTASENCFALLMLALHPQVQQKVAIELEEIFGGDDRSPTYSDLQRMEYLDCVIHETLRLFPALPVEGREAQQDVTLSDKKVLAKGVTTAFFIYGLHRDPRYFPNPEAFIPERFLAENSRSRHPFSFLPFSAGARNCIGQKYAMLQMKTTLSTLVRQFKILPSQRMPTMESIKLLITPTLRAKDGCWVKLEKRL